MRSWNSDPEKITRLCVNIGLAYLLAYLPLTIISLIQEFLPNIFLSIFVSIAATIVNIFYLFILLGLFLISKEHSNKDFARNIKLFFIFDIILIICNSFAFFTYTMSPTTRDVVMTSEILIAVLIGVINIRLAKNFESLQEYFGKDAVKAGKWSCIAGWLIVSFIFLPIGIVILWLSNYYEWRIIRQRLISLNVK